MSVFFKLEAPFRGEYRLHRESFGSGEPSVAVVAGVHGDEVTGVYALNLIAGMLRVQRAKGLVHLLPCVNVFGAEEGRKRWPLDDRDLNDVFPGDPQGSPAERVADAVLRATDANVCIEVQTGSAAVSDTAHARAGLSGSSLELARASGLPVVWRRSAERFETGLVGAWRNAGRTAVVLRGGRGGTLDVDVGRSLAGGVVRILGELGLLAHTEPVGAPIVTTDVRDHRCNVGGFFVPEVKVGERVVAGQLLGLVRAPLGGQPHEPVHAQGAGVVLSVRVYPMVHARELVVRVAVDSS